MKQINTLTIIGVGLIGGSIAKKAKEKKLAKNIIAFGRRKSILNKALRQKVIDKAAFSLAQAVKDADMVVICTPVGLISHFLKECEKYCKEGCVISDVGSTKKEIVDCAEKIFHKSKNKFFVGAHPMAGSEKKSFDFSEENLFNKAICFLTKTAGTSPAALKKMKLFWKALGAVPVIISPEKHDKIVAVSSHLPHAIADSLINSSSSASMKFVGNSFKDITRIASSDANLWADIFLSNKQNVTASIDAFIKELKSLKEKIQHDKKNQLTDRLNKAKLTRAALIKNER